MTYNSVDAVIFDFDGVFVDSFWCIFGGYNCMREKMGFRPFGTIGEFRAFYTVNFDKNYDAMGLVGEARKKAYAYIQEYVNGNYPKVQFFEDMVDAAKKISLPMGIASSGEASVIRGKLRERGIEGLFRSVVGFEHVKSIKPSPEPLLLCAEQLGVKIEEAAYVGDTAVDIQAGKNAKAKKVIAAAWGFDSIEKLAAENPDALITSPKDLMGFL